MLKLAWRNLWRNPRRTAINMSAVGLGLFLTILYGGLIDGMIADAKNEMANTGAGHVEIYAPTWRGRQAVSAFLPTPRALLARLALPEGSRVSARVVARGLLTSAHGSRGVQIHGVDPATEAPEARYLTDVREGETLAAGDDRGILIGQKLAQRLQLKVGQRVRLMAQRTDGEMGADLYRVRGIYHSISSGLSESRVIVTAGAAQHLLELPDAAHQVVIQLPRAEDADSIAAALRASLGPAVDVVSYGELMPALKTLERTIDGVMMVMAFFVYLLVGLGILNTTLMSVLERTHELGVMQAVGSRPGRIRWLLLAESFWVATLSVSVGLTLGLSLNKLGEQYSLFGWIYRGVGESLQVGDALIGTHFYSVFSWSAGLRAALLVYAVTLLVSIYPALRVSRMRPADALRAV